ncbi:MAG: hypothetical protein F4Z84_00775 [Gammaproteobacteria bacterium]|nr:hypothetical protein [Gammaproteobacteria bacterium]
MAVLIWQIVVAGTVLVASRFHRRGHLYIAIAWSVFTISAVYSSSLVVLQLLVAWGTAAYVQAHRRNTQDESPSTYQFPSAQAPASRPSGSIGGPATPSLPEIGQCESRQVNSEQVGQPTPTTKGGLPWYPTFQEAAAHAREQLKATVTRDGAGYRVDVHSAVKASEARAGTAGTCAKVSASPNTSEREHTLALQSTSRRIRTRESDALGETNSVLEEEARAAVLDAALEDAWNEAQEIEDSFVDHNVDVYSDHLEDALDNWAIEAGEPEYLIRDSSPPA